MQEPYDILIEGGTIVTVDPDFSIITNGRIGIRQDRIAALGPILENDPAPPASRLIDASGCLVLPGLVNTHTHLPMSLFRGLADDMNLHDWLHNIIFPAEARFVDPDTVRSGTMLSCAELILSGTTTCCDGYFHESETAEAVRQSGLRAIVGQGIIDFAAPGAPDPDKNIEHALDFVARWHGRCERIQPSLFCHSPYTCSAGTLQTAKQAARQQGVLFQIHLAETRSETGQIRSEQGTSPIEFLKRLDLLDDQTLLVHCVWLETDDIRRLAPSGARVSHNPQSNAKLAVGVAPAIQLLRAGVRMGLGTDGSASNNGLDLFAAMDLCAKLHKVTSADPTALDARSILKLATIDGAAAIGLDHLIGSLEIGKKADIIMVDLQQPHLTPIYHPESHLVYAARGSDVKMVLVDGRLVMENGHVLTMDVEKVMDEVNRIAEKIKRFTP